MIRLYNKEESIEEAFGRFGSKMVQPTITDYNALYSYLEQNGIDPKFCRGAILYGDLGQEWRITGYNLSDPENPLIALQSFSQPEETIMVLLRFQVIRFLYLLFKNGVKNLKINNLKSNGMI